MKKILVFLLLITGLVKAQVVVPKSTTTFSNILATGNLTVNGTARVTGATTLTGAAKLTNTLNYEGNTTWNTNQTNTLTTGNTGTIAVLSDAVFPVQCFTGSQGATMNNPADGTTYYFVNTGYLASSTATAQTIVLPYNCVLVGYDINATVAGIVGSSETSTISIRVNNSTDVTLNSSVTFSNTSAYQKFSQNGLNTNFSANDAISIKWVCPTWVTNPTAVYLGITLWFVRRQ